MNSAIFILILLRYLFSVSFILRLSVQFKQNHALIIPAAALSLPESSGRIRIFLSILPMFELTGRQGHQMSPDQQ